MTHDIQVGDRRTGKLRRLSEMCSTCIMRPAGDRIQLDNSRVTEFIKDAIQRESYVICHSTLPAVAPAGVQPAICRGFSDRITTNALRVGERLCGFQDVPPPTFGTPKDGALVDPAGHVIGTVNGRTRSHRCFAGCRLHSPCCPDFERTGHDHGPACGRRFQS